MTTVWNELEQKCIENAKLCAFSDNAEFTATYSDLRSYIYGSAHTLLEKVPVRTNIAIMLSNPYWEAIYVLAGLAAGYVVVPLPQQYGVSTCLKTISQLNSVTVICDSTTVGVYKKEHKTLGSYIIINEIACKQPFPLPSVYENDLALIMFTSGTTGMSKGVMLSHRNVVANIKAIASYFMVSSDDSILILRPLFHVAVMTGELLLGIYKGMQISFYEELFNPKRVLKYLDKNGTTVLCATPTIFGYLSRIAFSSQLRLSHCVISGEILTKAMVSLIRTAFPYINFYHVYGLTEASPRVSYLPPELFNLKPTSVGIPIGTVTLRIIGKSGEDVPNGTAGELLVKGLNVMRGYYEQPDLTNKKIRSGWLHTGDIAQYDKDGYLYILGRIDEMIIRAGVNIYPTEIENVLLSSTAVLEAFVYGKEDDNLGQQIIANVVLKKDIASEDLYKLCRTKLPQYSWPSQIVQVSSLEKNSSGKIIRKNRMNDK